MGICKYCRKDAGWFKSEHAECKWAHDSALKKMRDLCIDAALSGEPDPGLESQLRNIAQEARVNSGQVRPIVLGAIDDALQDALGDHLLERDELQALNRYKDALKISDREMESRGLTTKIRQAVLLRSLFEDGAIPKREQPRLGGRRERLPFNMMKSESLLWVFRNVDYLTEVVSREFQAGSSGMSFRVARGVYYRTGSSRGRTVTTKSMEVVDSGMMGVTTKHIYWAGQEGFGNSQSFRIRLNRIVSLEPYEDGISVMRDTQRAKPEGFVGMDGGFAANLVEIASYRMDEDPFTTASETLDEMLDDMGAAFAAGAADSSEFR